MWNSIVRRFTLDDEFSCLLLNLSISRISISGKFSYIFYILTQLEWSWPSVTKTVLRATSFPWKPSSSYYSAPEYHGNEVVPRCNSKQYSTMLQGVPGASQIKDWMHRSRAFHFTPNRNFRKLLLNVIIFNIAHLFLWIWKKKIALM